jgi:hypothetical protein
MNATRCLTRLTLAAALLLAAARSASAQGMQQKGGDPQQIWLTFEKELGLQASYSADMEIQTMGMNMTSKIYRDASKTRTEMTMPFMNLKMVALQLTENGKPVSYTLFPDKKKYFLTPTEEEAGQGKPDYTLTDAGTEAYEGATCKKRRLTVKLPDGNTQAMDMLFSPAQKNMPVKMTANAQMKTQDGEPPMTLTSVILFKNYRFGAQNAALFAIPKDYTQAKNMQEVMTGGGLFGGLGQPGAIPQGQPRQGAEALPPEALKAMQEAQAEAEKAAAEARQQQGGAQGEAMRQGLQTLRGLLGK